MSSQWPSAVSTSGNLFTAANFVSAQLVGDITSTTASLTLSSITGFPASGGVVIGSEVIYYAAIIGFTLTGCTRGADGTTAASHKNGAAVRLAIIANYVNALTAEVIAVEQDLFNRFGFGPNVVLPSGVDATFGNLTPTTVPYLDNTATLKSSAVTPTELGYVHGVTSSIQTQLNSLASASLTSAHLYVGNASNIATDRAITGDVAFTNTGVVSVNSVQAGVITNTMVNAAAAIAYSKLALTGSIVNADINASAAIAYSKLTLTGSIVNADVNASAAIAYSKLNLALSIVNADVSTSAAIAYSKLNLATSIVNADVSGSAAIAYSKLNLSGSIVNADVGASAAIAYSKLAALGTAKALQSNAATGFIEVSAVTNTELGYLSGVTSALQTQIAGLSPIAGSSSIVTVGTVTAGTWSATTIAVNKGGTGQTSYTDGQLLIGNSSGNTLTKATLTGTTSQVTVTNGNGSITLALPQNIATSSSPSFAAVTLSNTTNQIVLGTTNTVTINSTAPSASRVYAIADVGQNANFTLDHGDNSIFGNWTFLGSLTSSQSSPGAGTGIIVKNSSGSASSGALVNIASSVATGSVYTQYSVNLGSTATWLTGADAADSSAYKITSGAFSAQALKITTGGSIFLGSASNISTSYKLAVNNANAGAMVIDGDFLTERYGGASAGLYTQVANGTFGSPTLFSANTQIGFLNYRGYDGSTFQNAAQISIETDGTPAANSMPGRVIVLCTPSGSTTSSEVARFNSTGVKVTGDIYSTALTDYSSTSTITGWTSFTTKHIFYKLVGKTMTIYFFLSGTSNATTASFTVPTNANSSVDNAFTAILISNNGSTPTGPGVATISSGTPGSVRCFPDWTTGSWTNSGTKTCAGQITYETV